MDLQEHLVGGNEAPDVFDHLVVLAGQIFVERAVGQDRLARGVHVALGGGQRGVEAVDVGGHVAHLEIVVAEDTEGADRHAHHGARRLAFHPAVFHQPAVAGCAFFGLGRGRQHQPGFGVPLAEETLELFVVRSRGGVFLRFLELGLEVELRIGGDDTTRVGGEDAEGQAVLFHSGFFISAP